MPLLCLNPDRVSVQPDGTFALCPGAFAARYETMGGSVRTWGRPGAGIYAAAPRGRRAGVGDLRSGIHSSTTLRVAMPRVSIPCSSRGDPLAGRGR